MEKIIRNDLKKNVHDEYKIHYPLTTKIQNFLSRTVQTGVWECVIQMVEEEKVIDRNQVEIKDTESFGGKRNIRILVSFNYDMIRKKNQHPDLSSLILQLIKRKTLFYPSFPDNSLFLSTPWGGMKGFDDQIIYPGGCKKCMGTRATRTFEYSMMGM